MFKFLRNERGGSPALCDIPAVSGTVYKIGLPLTAAGAVVSGETAPDYICAQETTGTEGGFVKAIAVSYDDVYLTKFTAAPTAINAGDKVTIASDGAGITATKTNGVAKVIKKYGDASGSMAEVKF